MTEVIVRPGIPSDGESLAPHLRVADIREIEALTDEPHGDALRSSVLASQEAWAAEYDGTVIALGGFSKSPCGTFGLPWLMGSKKMVEFPQRLLQEAEGAIARWSREVPLLMNYSHAENVVHHEWLRRLGFTINPSVVQYGPKKAPFLLFYRYSECAS